MKRRDLQEFIYFITQSKRLSRAQQRKRDALLARDYTEMLHMVGDERTREQTTKVDERTREQNPKKDETIRMHNPQGVISFIRQFSIDDSLKWYTHKWDKPEEPFNIQQLIDNSTRNYKKLRKYSFGDENIGVPASLFYHVWNFINPENTSSYPSDQMGERFKTKWSDTNSWCEQHPGLWPGAYITEQGIPFESDINRFKRTIEFRTDFEPKYKFSFQIKSLIRKAINGAVKLEFSEQFERLGRYLKFYCNVNAIYIGISKLCDWVTSYKAMGDTLYVDLDVSETQAILTLLHKGSAMSGTKEKINGLSGDFKSIREIFFSACDFEVSGKFNEENVRIIALDGNASTKGGTITTPTNILPNEINQNGVCYTLKFYLQ